MIALSIVCFMIPLCIASLKLLSKHFVYQENVQDELSLIQLRRILLLGTDMHNYGSYITFEMNDSENTLSLINSKLILQPGTRIFLSDIDSLYFETKQNTVYVVYERKNDLYSKAIANE